MSKVDLFERDGVDSEIEFTPENNKQQFERDINSANS